MNEPWAWNEADLQRLVDQRVPESISLDYKAGGALPTTSAATKEFSKDIAAFANSAGGVLVYGIEEDRSTHLPARLVGVDADAISHESLEQIANSVVQPRVDGLRIARIPLPSVAPNSVAYIVYVPQSFRAPHQSSDKKFYKRFNFQSVPMEQYEVMDVARRLSSPKLSVRLQTDQDALAPSAPNVRSLKLWLALFNEAEHPALHARVQLEVEERLEVVNEGSMHTTHWTSSGYIWPEAEDSKTRRVMLVQVLSVAWSAGTGLACFKGAPIALMHAPLIISLPRVPGVSYLLRWTVHAPLMAPQKGCALLTEHADGWQLQNELQEDDAIKRIGFWVPSGQEFTPRDDHGVPGNIFFPNRP